MESNVPIGELSDIAVPGFIFPSITYLLILHQQNAHIDLGAHFVKQSPRNHFFILSANGQQKLSIPLESKKGIPTATSEMRISEGSWYKNQITAIQSAYGKSAFYFHFKDELDDMMKQMPGANLSAAITRSIEFLTRNLRVTKPHFNHTFSPDSYRYDWRMVKALPCNGDITKYHQVFSDRFVFQDNLSALDLLFNLGPEASGYIQSQPKIKLDLEDLQSS